MAEQQTAAGATAGVAASAPSTGQTGAAATPATKAPESGKGGATPPDTGKGEAAPAAKGADEAATAKKAAAQPPAWDDDTVRWLKSKGHDPAAFDPANEHHKRLIKIIRDSEAEQTRKAQEAKAREILEKSRVVTEKYNTNQPKELTPLEQFEEEYAAEVQRAMRYLGCTTAEELAERNPKLYRELENAYLIGKQDAWIKQQEWQKQKEAEAMKAAQMEAEMRKAFEASKQATEKIIAEIRAKNPNFDKHLAESGADAFLRALEETHALPREMLFVNPEIAAFIANAAEAIAYKNDEPARLEKWKQEYELQKAEIASASAPKPAGASTFTESREFSRPRSFGQKLEAAITHKR